MAEDSGSGGNPMEREAKDDINAVRDIVSSEHSGIDDEIAHEQAEIDRLMPLVRTENQGAGISMLDHQDKLEELQKAKAIAGCSPKMLLVLFVVLIALLAGVAVLALGGDDKKSAKTGGPPAAAGGNAAPAGGDATAATALAGHWTLAEGLQDMTGRDEMLSDRFGDSDWTLGPRSASFEVGDDGAVTSGSYHATHTAKTGDCTTVVTLDATTATGAIHADAFSNVQWDGTQQLDKTCGTSGGGAQPVEMWFYLQGQDLVGCYLPLTAPDSCPSGKVDARFTK